MAGGAQEASTVAALRARPSQNRGDNENHERAVKGLAKEQCSTGPTPEARR